MRGEGEGGKKDFQFLPAAGPTGRRMQRVVLVLLLVEIKLVPFLGIYLELS